jgi:hypothetical protein
MRQAPGSSCASVVSRRRAASSVTPASSAGTMPRTTAPRISSPRASSDWLAMNGAAPTTAGFSRARATVARQSRSAAPAPSNTSICAITLSMRSVTSFWKPFITDSTMINAATPSAMPSIDTPEMNEMKPLRRPVRPARV